MAEAQGVTDDQLIELSKNLSNEDAEKLGSKLGFKRPEVQKYIKTNTLTGEVRTKGTEDMLFAWRKKTRKKDQRSVLEKAIVDAELGELLDNGDIFADDGVKTEASSSSPAPAASASASATQGATTVEVTDEQLDNLSELLPQDKYRSLSTKLGLRYEKSGAILTKHLGNTNAAYREVLQIWKQGGGERPQLEKALEETGLKIFCKEF